MSVVCFFPFFTLSLSLSLVPGIFLLPSLIDRSTYRSRFIWSWVDYRLVRCAHPLFQHLHSISVCTGLIDCIRWSKGAPCVCVCVCACSVFSVCFSFCFIYFCHFPYLNWLIFQKIQTLILIECSYSMCVCVCVVYSLVFKRSIPIWFDPQSGSKLNFDPKYLVRCDAPANHQQSVAIIFLFWIKVCPNSIGTSLKKDRLHLPRAFLRWSDSMCVDSFIDFLLAKYSFLIFRISDSIVFKQFLKLTGFYLFLNLSQLSLCPTTAA